MAITHDNSSGQTTAQNVSSINATHTCNGADRLLYVTVITNTTTVTGVTYNGVSMTNINTVIDTVPDPTRRCTTFYLVNPSSGSNTIAVTLSGTTSMVVVYSSSYNGVSQSNPVISSAVVSRFTGTSISSTLSSAYGGYLVMSGTFSNGTLGITPSTNCVMRQTEVLYIGSYQIDNTVAGTGTSSIGYTCVSMLMTGISVSFRQVTGSSNIKALVVGGGGGGGATKDSASGGGGGAGQYQYNSSFAVTPQQYSVTVGVGGSAGVFDTSLPTAGGSSIFDTITSVGGGRGGQYILGAIGGGGASGGGAAGDIVSRAGGTASAGYNGGSNTGASPYNGAGGGGSSAVGTNANNTNGAKVSGGAGTSNSITGSAVTYATGGAGGAENNGPFAVGENGGANTGNGGGGGSVNGSNNGGAGGSGIVILRWLKSDFGNCSITGVGNTITDATDDSDYSVAKFIVSGTITFTEPVSSSSNFFNFF